MAFLVYGHFLDAIPVGMAASGIDHGFTSRGIMADKIALSVSSPYSSIFALSYGGEIANI